ncbi:hypothetical protein D8B46_04250 [Candidatus Gracilibacteria bacterium]|nr:MAG: hypothetical protein D8B46_04250 [Candidatus Gracilibacteria bacterium]
MLDLILENRKLKKQLEIAEKWIKREVLSNIKNINIERISGESIGQKENFFSENIEELVYNQVSDFFGEERFIYFSKDILENIVSSELLFSFLRKNKQVDGLAMLISYQKIFDLLVEEQITKPFRKYFNSKNLTFSLENDLIEKNLYNVLFNGHILGFSRFFALLKNISEDKVKFPYSKTFLEFLEKYSYIKNILLDDEFLDLYGKIVDLEVFGAKRHIGKVSFDDIFLTRKYFFGDFVDKNCFFYKLSFIYEI